MPDIRISQLPLATGPTAPAQTDFVALDNGTTRKAPLSGIADAVRPMSSQAEAEAGVNAVKGMSPLTTKQSIASEVGSTIASASQGALASTALQPSAIGVTVQGYSATLDAFSGTLAQSRAYLNIDRNLINDFGAVGDGVTNDQVALNSAISSGLPFSGAGKIYAVDAKPVSFINIKNAAFKVGTVIHPSADFLPADTAKITNGLMYTAWAQDKAYKVDTQLRMWVNEKESHGDGTGRIGLYFSDDGGSSYSFGEYLEIRASGNTLWSAGYDGTNEYLFVRIPAGGTDVPPYTYQMWKRTLGTSDLRNYNGPWTKTNITFPMPVWAVNAQPIMIHSFCVGHSGSICVGGSLGNGTGVYRSTNGGTTWTFFPIQEGESTSEPTVRYVASLGLYCGFVRRGDGNPRWWVSTDNLATVLQWTAPATFFGPTQLEASTVSFDVDPSGNFHAVSAYRNGVIEGAGTDDRVSTFYLTGPVIAGSIWTAPNTKLYSLAQVSRSEQGGSSALGQGSVIATEGKVHLFYGMEGRTGVSGGVAKGNRVMDIVQTVIQLKDFGSAYDTRVDLFENRAAYTPLRKVSGVDAFVVPFTDTANWNPGVIVSGRPNFYRNLTIITLSSDTLNLTGTRSGLYVIDTEGAGATDNLSTITDPDAQDGDVIILGTSSGARDVIVKNGTGNIICGSDRSLDGAADKISLMRFGSNWHMVAFSDNGT